MSLLYKILLNNHQNLGCNIESCCPNSKGCRALSLKRQNIYFDLDPEQISRCLNKKSFFGLAFPDFE